MRKSEKNCLQSLNHENKLFASLPKKKQIVCKQELSELQRRVLRISVV